MDDVLLIIKWSLIWEDEYITKEGKKLFIVGPKVNYDNGQLSL